jgi:regulator of RNase E activity RraA
VAWRVPIRVGDIPVSSGDYIAADRSGCVVVPAALVADVLTRAEMIFAKSEEMAAAVERGLPVSKVMGGDYESMLER